MYFQVLDGDRRKARAESNDDPSQGGGARDLRFPREFEDVLHRMFPDLREHSHGNRKAKALVTIAVHTGDLHWERPDGKSGKAGIEVWPPTNSRPREIRIARIHKLPVFGEMLEAPVGVLYLFFVEDNEGTVRVHFADEQILWNAGFNQAVGSAVRRCADGTRENSRVMGYIDYDTGESYCHGS